MWTADDLLKVSAGKHYEIVEGNLIEKPTSALASHVNVQLLVRLGMYVYENELGHCYDGTVGYHCFPSSRHTVRKPDHSFVARGRLQNEESPEGNMEIAPDLVIETVAPCERYNDIEDKVADYRNAGVRLIWILSPTSHTIMIRRLDGTCSEVDKSGQLDGEDVVPGFTCNVRDIFSDD